MLTGEKFDIFLVAELFADRMISSANVIFDNVNYKKIKGVTG